MQKKRNYFVKIKQKQKKKQSNKKKADSKIQLMIIFKIALIRKQ